MESRPHCGTNFKSIIRQRIHDTGIWNDSRTHGIHWTAKVSILCYLVTSAAQMITLFVTKHDPKALLACFSVFSFCFMGLLKLYSLLVNHKHWRLLINKTESLETEQTDNSDSLYDYKSDGEEDDRFSGSIRSYTRKISWLSTYLPRVYYFTAAVFISSPFIEYGYHLYRGKRVERFPHVLPVWAPLDSSAFGYFVTILAEIIAAVYCVRIHFAFDLTAIGFMIFVRGQFNLLHSYSESIGGKGEICDLSNRRDVRAHFRIKKCHYVHVSLLKTVNRLGKLIQNILGIYFVLATFTLCSVAVQLQSEHLSATQLISLLQYMLGTLTQLFLFCQYGDAVFTESSVAAGEGPFCASSWCLSSRIRREIAILCVGMSRPRRIFAGPISTLGLPSFIQILRTAYSYYTVLRQTSE